MNASINIPRKFLKVVKEPIPSSSNPIGVVSSKEDLDRGKQMSRFITWVIVDQLTTASEFELNKEVPINFFTNDRDKLLDDLVNLGYNARKVGEAKSVPQISAKQKIDISATLPESTETEPSIFTSVEMVEIISKMCDKEANLYIEIMNEDPTLTPQEIAIEVSVRLQQIYGEPYITSEEMEDLYKRPNKEWGNNELTYTWE